MQELLGGKFGEMSTFMNYTYQSFNFRNRQGARPFYDLVANIAAEEFGHVELVAATINTMLTGASPDDVVAGPDEDAARRRPPAHRNLQHFIAGGQGALCQDSMAKPWNGSYVFSSGDLVEDLTHNFFLETGARNNKLKVYEMVDHPAARALTGYLLVRGGVHQVAYARALENLTGANLMKLFPSPRIPTDKIPESKVHMDRGEHLKLYRFSPDDYQRAGRRLQRPASGDARTSSSWSSTAAPEGVPGARPAAAARGVRAGLRAGGDRRDRPQAAQGRRPLRRADRRRRLHVRQRRSKRASGSADGKRKAATKGTPVKAR